MTRFLLEPLEKKWDWAANTHMFYLQGRKTAQKYQTPINPIQISERVFPYLHNINYNNLNLLHLRIFDLTCKFKISIK